MSDYLVDVFKKNNRFDEYKNKVINWNIIQGRHPYFQFVEPLRRRYWVMARENLLKFKEEFDIEALDYSAKVFYMNMILSKTFEEFEISIKADNLENENKKLKKEIADLSNENKKLKKEKAKLMNKNKKIKKSYDDIKNSRSWKLTNPLRRIKKLISK